MSSFLNCRRALPHPLAVTFASLILFLPAQASPLAQQLAVILAQKIVDEVPWDKVGKLIMDTITDKDKDAPLNVTIRIGDLVEVSELTIAEAPVQAFAEASHSNRPGSVIQTESFEGTALFSIDVNAVQLSRDPESQRFNLTFPTPIVQAITKLGGAPNSEYTGLRTWFGSDTQRALARTVSTEITETIKRNAEELIPEVELMLHEATLQKIAELNSEISEKIEHR